MQFYGDHFIIFKLRVPNILNFESSLSLKIQLNYKKKKKTGFGRRKLLSNRFTIVPRAHAPLIINMEKCGTYQVIASLI